jgi:hypothetical protein
MTKTDKGYLGLIIGLVLFRLCFVPFMGLMPQDAYYTFYSEHLDWSYYDHPPMVAYLIKVFTIIFGKAAWVIKLTAWTTSLATLYLVYLLAKKMYDHSFALRAVAILATTVMMSIVSLVMTPDVPLLLFWMVSVLLFHHAIFQDRRIYFVLAGLAMGLAFDSKYTAVFLPAGMFAFLIFSNEKRFLLRTVWPYLSVVAMALMMIPVVYWNYDHDFASFAFQSSNRASVIAEEGWKPSHILGSIAMQSTVLIPTLFIFFFLGLWQFAKRYKWKALDNTKALFLLAFFLPVFGGFMTLSWFYWVKLNWIMPAYLTGVLFITPLLPKAWERWQIGLSVFLHLLITIQLVTYAVPIKSDDTWWGWEELAERVEEVMSEESDAFLFAGDHYKTTAQLDFYLDREVLAHNVVGAHAVQYDILYRDFEYLNGKDAIYIDSDPQGRSPDLGQRKEEMLLDYFQEIEYLEPIRLERRGEVVRSFRVVRCKGYTAKPRKPLQ